MRRPTFSLLAVVLSTACGPQETSEIPGPQPTQDLEVLNQELSITWRDEALARRSHFAPLCDAQGYPLVGNLATKGGTTASQFCALVREGK